MPDTLIKLAGRHAPQALRQALGALLSPAELQTLDVLHADEAELTYAYLDLAADAGPGPASPDPAARRDALRRACLALCPEPELVGLQCTLDLPGHSARSRAQWHYIVETDVRPEAEDDFNAWYRTEHMPGLAAVPGTAWTRRYLSTSAPRHYATYDLAARVYEKDSLFAQAMKMGELEALGFSWRDEVAMDAGLEAVTPAHVRAVARQYLVDDTLTVAVLDPQPLTGAPRSAAYISAGPPPM